MARKISAKTLQRAEAKMHKLGHRLNAVESLKEKAIQKLQFRFAGRLTKARNRWHMAKAHVEDLKRRLGL